jgi:hypothetical protein
MIERMATICPFCKYKHDAVSRTDDRPATPKDNDITLCFNCGRICVFDSTDDGGLRKPTLIEQDEFDHDPQLDRLIDAWKQVKRTQ